MPSKKSRASSGQKRSASATTSMLGPATQLYRGKKDKLVISIDIGTTCSAVSLCFLRPQRPINLQVVSGWPGQISEQEHKVPSVIYYDQIGRAVGWGAETTNPVFRDRATKENWVRVEWFKLSLKPPRCSTDMDDHAIPKLPAFLNGQQIYSDFLTRLFNHIKTFFSKHHAGGEELWERLLPTTDMVFTVPNGWELKQQYEIRRAAVSAGFLGFSEVEGGREGRRRRRGNGPVRHNTYEKLMVEALSRIRFVSESEAAMIYAADSERVDAWLQEGNSVIVCDAGGGTIDIAAYKIKEEYPLKLEERFSSTSKVRTTPWDTDRRIEQLMDYFERETKKRFSYPMDYEYSVGAGGSTETFCRFSGIRDGMLFIPSYDFETFFEPTMTAIKQGIQDMWEKSKRKMTNVIMVGGLMNSSYAFKQLELWGAELGIKLAKPDGTMAKAVSHGALLWYLAKPVTGYIVKFHYGSDVCLKARELSNEMISGRETHMEVNDFEKYFDQDEPIDASRFEDKIYICRNEEVPIFIADAQGQLNPGIEHVCSIIVDLKRLFNLTPWLTNKLTGKHYKCLKYSIAIMNDGYDLDAYSYWRFGGKTHVGDAKVVVPAISESRSPSPS
ncbi:hypothetical protein D9756_009098 [Leucocoprinus leucothites]|uniref:Uncharacterized protein n=1 Tax=Leucocoprinus leucothites TaxID=201217 RepID=A0A8H5CZU1_9AGAR|nr:hypothetical protein D9756_009098 [Leucoagaricus leucothites]